ncbi:MAG TPA: DNA-3-methyladenine glycosylase [Candidatus Paceibacterota bacterium]|nr:DNA-3-methyladenine glycosylase [Candidatus Paceibacterota bacterium]
MRLNREFFNRSTLVVARELIGKYLVRNINGELVAGQILETEAYHGHDDRASHAWRGRTPRTEVMFGPPGHAYVYLIYGMYHCMNISTGPEGFPAAVLIRSLDLPGANGPGRLCRLLNIDRTLVGTDVIDGEELWIEDRGLVVPKSKIERTPRIGIDYAGPYKDKPWRFVLESGE